MTAIAYDKLTEAYVASREQIRELKKRIESIEEVQKKIEDWLLGQLQSQGLQDVKTAHGTAYIAVKESVTVGDWDAALGWIKENGAWEYLNKALNKTAVLEKMGEKRDSPPIPGANYSAIRTVQIRK